MTPNTKATALQERRFNRPSNSPFWAKIRAQMKMLLDQSFLFRTKSFETDHYYLRYIIFIFSSHDSANDSAKS
jgi:hypothetical protein